MYTLLVIITENYETDLPQQIGSAIKQAEERKPGLTITDEIIQLDRENEDESFRQCKD